MHRGKSIKSLSCFLRRLAEGVDAGFVSLLFVSAGRLHKQFCKFVVCVGGTPPQAVLYAGFVSWLYVCRWDASTSDFVSWLFVSVGRLHKRLLALGGVF